VPMMRIVKIVERKRIGEIGIRIVILVIVRVRIIRFIRKKVEKIIEGGETAEGIRP
jgi:hypothetical protein